MFVAGLSSVWITLRLGSPVTVKSMKNETSLPLLRGYSKVIQTLSSLSIRPSHVASTVSLESP